jgi:hypothetical protein
LDIPKGNEQKMTRPTIVGLLGMALAATSIAQFKEVNSTVNGTGTLRIGGQSHTINSAILILKRDRKCEVIVVRPRVSSFILKGTFTVRNDGQVAMSFTDGTDDARGTGNATYDSFLKLEKLEASGASRRGGFSIEFSAGEGGWSGGGRPGEGDSNPAGTYAADGLLTIGRQVTRISSATIRPGKNKRLELVLSGQGRSFRFDGEWFDRRGSKSDFHIDKGPNSGTNARGEMFYRSSRLDSLNFDGKDDRGQLICALKLKESGGAVDPVGDPKPIEGEGWMSSNSTKSGNGDAREGATKVREKFNRARVRFDRNGTFQIELYGDKTWRFDGSWTRKSGNAASLDVKSSNQDRRTNGSGSVTFRGSEFDIVVLSVRLGDKRYLLQFDAK